ncbi:MAG: ABC transporter ATP-binding protein [Saprospiraceae bacterium]|nr:ABC transporter ATP-binding protein [Saprospiraceae bacterium]
MSLNPVIEVADLWKKYRKGRMLRYKSLRESLSSWGHIFNNAEKEYFWALQNISFTVPQGESLGIIGKNGAGKSTLLKILSRVTPPTKGEVRIKGKVASLLEVGTGFHPELTGRENIFFNGSLLGMSYREIKQRFDEIIEFAGVAAFTDTQLKYYSTGMQLRLAFSVASHLDAQILLIDEVLSVGDFEFQKKCFAKIEEIKKDKGKTILLVSHDTKSILMNTTKCIILENGKCDYAGPTEQAVQKYFNFKDLGFRQYEPENVVQRVVVRQEDNLLIECYFSFDTAPQIPHFGFVVSTMDGVPVFGSNPTIENTEFTPYSLKKGKITVEILQPELAAGIYTLSIWLGNGNVDIFEDRDCLSFSVDRNFQDSNIGHIKGKFNFKFENQANS